jgi:O-acetyl-ADP-ribose deacetylase (regulator of RNase III)
MTNVVAEAILCSGSILRLVHGDITQEHTDAIVNAANAQLVHA